MSFPPDLLFISNAKSSKLTALHSTFEASALKATRNLEPVSLNLTLVVTHRPPKVVPTRLNFFQNFLKPQARARPAQHCLDTTGKDLAIAASLPQLTPQPPPPLSYPTELRML
ncbi:hypothetical protein D9B85_10850 [Corynebacterium diphtheriae]|nr:hypothetical protein BUE68_11065 [Corynebacterium diphtheriae]OOG32749.1 hypothetical protein BKD86_0210415 [Corynebacterium diphtheriae]OSQ12252.1 hypothetical protein B1A55_11695 [Corynebacterium diphtheriae]OSQ20824.1 hypothetical protein B1A51_10605 [Corynebacterium diphtheriae]OWX94979.1 hypothetical protein B1A56_10785 [Corynebacterium diphtheriae]